MDNPSPKDTPRNGETDVLESIFFVSQVVPPKTTEQKRTECRPDQTPPLKTILECAAFFLGLFLAWIYWGQLDVMSGQLLEMRKAAGQARRDNAASITAQKEIAQSALAASQDNFRESARSSSEALNRTLSEMRNQTEEMRNSERAWVTVASVYVKKPLVGEKIHGRVVFTNSGKTPALHVRANVGFVVTDDTGIFDLPSDAIAKDVVGDSIIIPGGKTGRQPESLDTVDNITIKVVQNPNTRYYFWGEITYKDATNLKKTHFTRFCEFLTTDTLDTDFSFPCPAKLYPTDAD